MSNPLDGETIFLLFVTDIDGDEIYEGTYSTEEAALDQAEFIKEWDVTIKDHRIVEDYIRARSDS